MMGYCNFFNCFCEEDIIEKEQDEIGEYCNMNCDYCPYYEE